MTHDQPLAGLLVAEGVDGIEAGGAGGGVEARDEADDEGEGDGAEGQPPGNVGNFHAGQILPVNIYSCAPSQRGPNQPTERDTEETAEKSHGTSFCKEKAAHIAAGCAERFENGDFAATFEDGHHQSVDDAERSDGEGEASEEAEEKIEHGEDEAETFGGVEQGKGRKTQLLDRLFDLQHVLGRTNAHGECHVRRLCGIAGEKSLQVVRLGDMELLRGFEREVNTRASETSNPG